MLASAVFRSEKDEPRLSTFVGTSIPRGVCLTPASWVRHSPRCLYHPSLICVRPATFLESDEAPPSPRGAGTKPTRSSRPRSGSGMGGAERRRRREAGDAQLRGGRRRVLTGLRDRPGRLLPSRRDEPRAASDTGWSGCHRAECGPACADDGRRARFRERVIRAHTGRRTGNTFDWNSSRLCHPRSAGIPQRSGLSTIVPIGSISRASATHSSGVTTR